MHKYFLSKILVYPVKSLGWLEPPKWVVRKRGFELDRRWMLADANGNFVSQRRFPQLALLKVKKGENKLLVRDSISNDSIEIPFEPETNRIFNVKIFNDETSGIIVSKELSNWFTEFLKEKVELIFMPENFIRKVNPKYGSKSDVVSFADGFPYLLINSASVAELNGRLKNKIPPERFRPNLIIEGKTPFEEDKWKKIKIGEIIFKVVKPCSRCTVITVNQDTGETDAEPLKALSSFRKINNKVMFGQNLIAENEGTLKTGDKVEVLE